MTNKKNILLLMIDQQTASALRVYGGKTAKTPNIDRIAARGVVFDNAYTNFPVCSPSRLSMMCGRLATRVQGYDNATEFRAALPTMAHYLRHCGYQTCLSGKMHFIGPDQLHGFEERLTPEIYSADFLTMPDWDGDDDDFATDAQEALREAGPVARTVQMDYDCEAGYCAVQKIYDLARSDDERNFFLVASFTHPHEPFLCTRDYWDRYSDDEIELPEVGPFEWSQLDEHSRRIYLHYNLRDAEQPAQLVRNARRAYYGSMSFVDDEIGRILDALESVGMADDTVIMLTSDHGEMLGERGMWFKKTFFENSVRIPLIVSGKGIDHKRVGRNVSLVDLLPTFLDVADPQGQVKPVEPLDGFSLMPLVRGEETNRPDTIFSEMTCEGVPEPVMMVKHGSLKYIYSTRLDPLMYDLASDPNELSNLAGHPDYAEEEAHLRALGYATWGDLDVLRATIVQSQKTRLFIRSALEKGRYFSWDDNPHTTTGDRYLRHGKTYNAWNYGGVDKLRQRVAESHRKPPA